MSGMSQLDREPALKEAVAELFANGTKHKVIAEEFQVSPDTITNWRKRPDVQKLISKRIEERANAILSHTDTAILKRLEAAREEGAKPIPTEVLLRIRQTFAGEKVVVDTGNDRASAAAELLEAARKDPVLAAAIAATGDDDSS